MKRICYIVIWIAWIVSPLSLLSQDTIADYRVAKESVLRSIPQWAIEAAKSNLHIMYCGTSHSSQTSDGLRGLMSYKSGDDSLFAVSFNGVPITGTLDIHYRPSSPVNVYSARDLSNDSVDGNGHTGYFRMTEAYLDHQDHADINVVMWSWCSIEGHDVQIYLDNFAELIDMYRAGGSKGRTSSNAVTFVFMTGYARGSDGDTPEPPYLESPYQNHKRIVDFCRANGYFCLDYWSQDTYEYESDSYKPTESGNNNVQHKAYFDSHSEGAHWFATRDYNSGSIKWPAHCSGLPQHITSNRRAYAAWWIWARLAGWDGSTGGSSTVTLSAPNGGETLTIGQSAELQWTSSGTVSGIRIEYSLDNGSSWLEITSSTANDGSYQWTVPAPSSTSALIRISDAADSTVFDQSDQPFSISSASQSEIQISRGSLYFASCASHCTQPQKIVIANSGSGTLNWTAASDVAWLNCSPTSGTGNTEMTVSIDPAGRAIGVNYGVLRFLNRLN